MGAGDIGGGDDSAMGEACAIAKGDDWVSAVTAFAALSFVAFAIKAAARLASSFLASLFCLALSLFLSFLSRSALNKSCSPVSIVASVSILRLFCISSSCIAARRACPVSIISLPNPRGVDGAGDIGGGDAIEDKGDGVTIAGCICA